MSQGDGRFHRESPSGFHQRVLFSNELITIPGRTIIASPAYKLFVFWFFQIRDSRVPEFDLRGSCHNGSTTILFLVFLLSFKVLNNLPDP